MSRVAAVAARAWRALGDERLMLVLMGASIVSLPRELTLGGWHYLGAALDVVMIAYGVRAWRKIGRARRAVVEVRP